MSDRATIDIDCDHGVVSASSDHMSYRAIEGQAEMASATLIVMILMPQIRELLHTTKDQLKAKALEALRL